jgi:cytochrome P450
MTASGASDATAVEVDLAAGCPVLHGYDPLDPDEVVDPFPTYARARRELPVFYLEQHRFWSVTRREDVLAVLRDTKRFTNRDKLPMPLPPEAIRDRMPQYPFATGLVFLDDPEHRPARQMVQAPFTRKRVRDIEPMTRALADELLLAHDLERRIEFIQGYALPLALAVIGTIIGLPQEDFPLLRRAVDGAFQILSGTRSDEEIIALAEDQLAYWEYLLALVDERRVRPRDDFTSVLAGYVNPDGSRPTSPEIAAHVNSIVGAGFETSAQMMAFGVASILNNRDQWELLKSDRSLLPGAVEECVRYRTVSKRNFRIAATDVEIGGVAIPAGSLIGLLTASANRDEAAFPEPDRFDIARRADNLTFGRGKHFCLGAPLSKVEMRITLEVLLDLAPDARLVEDQVIEYKPGFQIDAMRAMFVDLGPAPAGDLGSHTDEPRAPAP